MEQQVQKIIELTENGLTQMAASMNVALPQLWEILIRQQYVEAIQAFVGLILCLIVCRISYKHKKYLQEQIEEVNPLILTGITAFGIIFVLVFIDSIIGIGKVINPEYYAIQDIAEFIGQMKGGE